MKVPGGLRTARSPCPVHGGCRARSKSSADFGHACSCARWVRTTASRCLQMYMLAQVSFGDACVELATVTRRKPWDVLCPLLACDASNAEEMDRAGCGDAGCSGCPR